MPVLTESQIKDIVSGNGGINWILQLCDSHEELRRERNDLLLKCRNLILEKATIREKKEMCD